eukprot:703825-Amphidinium_carterae.1
MKAYIVALKNVRLEWLVENTISFISDKACAARLLSGSGYAARAGTGVHKTLPLADEFSSIHNDDSSANLIILEGKPNCSIACPPLLGVDDAEEKLEEGSQGEKT